MSVYLRKKDQIFSQNQLAIINQFIYGNEFSSNQRLRVGGSCNIYISIKIFDST